MRFYNRIIVLYRTIIYLFLFHSPKSHPVKFQQKNSMGEHRQSRDWANKQQWTARIRSNQVRLQIKIPSIASKFILQKTEVTHHSIPSINTPINPSSTPSSPPPWGAHLGRANAPAEAPGPGRSEEYTILCENYMHIKRSKMYRIILKHKIAKELENNA